MNKLKLTLNDSIAAKGLALLLLLWHHLFYTHAEYGKLIQWTAMKSSVCVSIFVILSGYGLAATFKPEESLANFYKKRLLKLYSTYWLVFIIFVPISMLLLGVSFESTFSPRVSYPYIGGLAQFLGLHMLYGGYGFNPTWWFMTAIIILYILFPFIDLIIEKYSYWALFVVAVYIILSGGGKLAFVNRYILPFTIGVFLNKWNLSEEHFLNQKITSLPRLLSLLFLCLAFTFFWAKFSPSPIKGLVWHYVFDLCLLSLFLIFTAVYLSKTISLVKKMLLLLGKHSFTVFLTHTFLYYLWFPEFFYSFKHPFFIMTALTLSSLLLAIALDKIHAKTIAILENFLNEFHSHKFTKQS